MIHTIRITLHRFLLGGKQEESKGQKKKERGKTEGLAVGSWPVSDRCCRRCLSRCCVGDQSSPLRGTHSRRRAAPHGTPHALPRTTPPLLPAQPAPPLRGWWPPERPRLSRRQPPGPSRSTPRRTPKPTCWTYRGGKRRVPISGSACRAGRRGRGGRAWRATARSSAPPPATPGTCTTTPPT